MPRQKWKSESTIESRDYVCGYCGNGIASDSGWWRWHKKPDAATSTLAGSIYICHLCDNPTFFDGQGHQTPGPLICDDLKKLPKESGIVQLYDEARRSFAANSPTAAVLCCRTLLMHIAEDKGLKEPKNFKQCVDYLFDEGYLGKPAKPWVDHIRDTGNDATHEIVIMSPDDARRLIKFSELVLKSIYEFPASLPEAKNGPVAEAKS